MIVDHEVDVPGIAIVRSSRPWARTLHRYVVDHGGAIVKTRPLEERQAIEDEYDVLIVDDISSFLTNHIIEEVHRRGRRVLGVYDTSEYAPNQEISGKSRLERIGADGVIDANATPEEFVRIIGDLAPAPEERAVRNANVGLLDIEEAHERGPGRNGQAQQGPTVGGEVKVPPGRGQQPRRRGHVTTILGASGGSGATELAIELGHALGRRGEKTVVVDGDELAPSLAQRLNLALHPNIRTAVDVVEHGAGRLSECLTTVATNLETLVGLPHPKDWIELRGSDMIAVIDELSRGRPQVIVNASPAIEDLAGFGGADRFAMTRAAVVSADLVIIVCPPSPMGVARLIDRVADLSLIAEGKPVHVVVNRVPKGNFKRNEIAREIQRNFAPAGIHFVAADPRVEKASWEGTLVPRGEFTKAVGTTIAAMVPKTIIATPRRGAPPPRGNGSGNHMRPQK
jgi:MinD-like ATPase involved in chromosome partitioning or flagellar assembly